MALNTIILPYNKILEVEECEPVSSPSSTSFDEGKSVPDLNSLYSPIHKTYNFPLELSEKKNKSSPISLDYSNNFNEIFFQDNNNEKIPLFIQKELTNFNKIKKDNKENRYNNIYQNDDNKENKNLERQSFEINSPYSSRSNHNPFKRADNISNLDENDNSEFSNNNINRNHRETDIIDRNKINQIYDNCINNPKINPVIEDRKIDSFMDDISNLDNKIMSINNEEKEKDKNTSLNKIKLPKIKPKINEVTKINISPSLKYRNSNPNPNIKNNIYCKKKILDSNRNFLKKGRNEERFSINNTVSLIRNSNKTDNFKEIKAKNRPLILNVNLKKEKLPSLKISQFQRILKDDGLFYLFRFFDYSDFINLFKTKNKQLYTLINTALVNVYYINIKESLVKYNNVIELLKCSIVQYKIKDALKIDFVISIRFINNKNNPNNNYKIKLGGPKNDKFTEPLYFQFGYIYNYYPKIKNKKELITKEEYENQRKRLKMYDYYTFDLYPENSDNNKIVKNNPIFIYKELNQFDIGRNNNIVNIQPILPFTINDKGIINLELYTTNNGFIDPDSIKIIIKSFNLKNYLKMLSDKGINNPRISECEDLCLHWKNINLYPKNKLLMVRLKKIFEPFFEIDKVYFGNIGVLIFKVYLKANKIGIINDKNKLEIKIKIKEKTEYIENEIRKNNLLFERRDIFELRVGDQIVYYFSMK